jgi:hypothetical protein
MIWSGWSKSDERKRGNEMAVTEKSFIFNNLSFLTSYPFAKTNGRKFGITLAKKRDLSENSSSQQENIFPLRVSNPIWNHLLCHTELPKPHFRMLSGLQHHLPQSQKE